MSQSSFTLPRVAIDPNGAAVALWAAAEGDAWVVRGASLPRRAAAWQEAPAPPLDPDRLPPPGDAPRLALNAAGDAVVLWRVPAPRPPGSTLQPYSLRAARRTGLGAWGPALTLADSARPADAALAPDGRAAAVWAEFSTGAASPIHLALGSPRLADFSAPETLPATGALALAAVNARGDVLVAWTAFALDEVTRAAIRPAGGTWGADPEHARRHILLFGHSGIPGRARRGGHRPHRAPLR